MNSTEKRAVGNFVFDLFTSLGLGLAQSVGYRDRLRVLKSNREKYLQALSLQDEAYQKAFDVAKQTGERNYSDYTRYLTSALLNRGISVSSSLQDTLSNQREILNNINAQYTEALANNLSADNTKRQTYEYNYNQEVSSVNTGFFSGIAVDAANIAKGIYNYQTTTGDNVPAYNRPIDYSPIDEFNPFQAQQIANEAVGHTLTKLDYDVEADHQFFTFLLNNNILRGSNRL